MDYMYQFLELVGMDRERIIFISDPVGAHQICSFVVGGLGPFAGDVKVERHDPTP